MTSRYLQAVIEFAALKIPFSYQRLCQFPESDTAETLIATFCVTKEVLSPSSRMLKNMGK